MRRRLHKDLSSGCHCVKMSHHEGGELYGWEEVRWAPVRGIAPWFLSKVSQLPLGSSFLVARRLDPVLSSVVFCTRLLFTIRYFCFSRAIVP